MEDALGYKVFDVPLLIGANWAILTVSCSAFYLQLYLIQYSIK